MASSSTQQRSALQAFGVFSTLVLLGSAACNSFAANSLPKDRKPWLVGGGPAVATMSGAECSFGTNESVEVFVALQIAATSENAVPDGVLVINQQFMYPLDELGDASFTSQFVYSGANTITLAGTARLPRRDCALRFDSIQLPRTVPPSGSLIAATIAGSLPEALNAYRAIRSAKNNSAADLATARLALERLNRVLGEPHPLTLVSHSRLAELENASGQYRLAANHFNRAWTGNEQLYGADSVETLISLDRLTWMKRELGASDEIVALAKKAQSLSVARWGPSHDQSMKAQHTLASMLFSVGQYDAAIAEGTLAYAQRSAALAPDHLDTLRSLNNLALMYRTVGRLREALAAQQTLHSAFQRTAGPDSMSTLVAGNNLALTLSDLGDSGAALVVLDATYLRLVATVGAAHPESARVLNSIGNVLAANGRFAESIDVFERVIEIRRSAYGPEHFLTLSARSNLAEALTHLGRHDEASSELKDVVAALSRGVVPEGDLTAAIRNSYVNALLAAGANEVVFDIASEALAIAQRNLPPTRYTVLQLRISLGLAQVAAGKSEQGLESLTLVLKEARNTLGDENVVTLSAFEATASVAGRHGRSEDAAAFLAEAVGAVERARSSPLLPPDYRQGLGARWRPHYANLALLRVQAGYGEEAFAVSELAKARGLVDSIARNRGLASGAVPAAEVQVLREYEVRLGKLDEAIGRAGDDVSVRIQLEAQKNDLVRKERELRNELTARYPKFGRLSEPKVVDRRSGALAIGRDGVFVSYLLVADKILIFTLTANGVLKTKTLTRPPDLDARITALRMLTFNVEVSSGSRPWRLAGGKVVIADAIPEPGANLLGQMDARGLAAELGKLLLEPVSSDLSAKRRWIICPDGPLALMPFEMLPIQGQLAIERANISYAQSLSVLNLIAERKRAYKNTARQWSMLAMGNPVYLARSDAAPAAVTPSAVLHLRSALRDRSDALGPLPSSQRELELVTRPFARSAVQIFSGSDASEATLKRLNGTGQLGRVRYVVLSAHGVLFDATPALSAVVLSQDNVDILNDGFITAAEWPQYDLRSDLIVLSACETGVGKVVTGEGVLGLPYALLVAGNTEAVLTLWKIEDQSASRFTGRLFHHLSRGGSVSDALSKTKREFLKIPMYGRPFFWAPYILYGS